MRYLALTLFILPALAQPAQRSETDVYTFDANGRRVLASQQVQSGAGGAEQRVRNMNGRVAPLERVEEKVLSDDGNARVIERIIRPFDANGAPQPPQRLRITEQKQADGSKRVETQVFQGNINGGYSLTERREALERTSNGQVIVDTEIARPTINGGLNTVEKLTSTTVTAGTKSTQDTTTLRRDNNGNFYAAAREVKETDKKDGLTVENTATYISSERRQLELAGQTVAETRKLANGAESRQVNIYGTGAAGRPAAGQPVLREQQLIDKTPTSGGTVETLSIRRPAVDNPNVLGPAQKISERVCTGPCQ